MMSEFVMANYSQNECSCQLMSSEHFGKLSERGVHLPHLAWVSFLSRVRVPPCGTGPNGSAITREKGRPWSTSCLSGEMRRHDCEMPTSLSVPDPVGGAQATPTARLMFKPRQPTALS